MITRRWFTAFTAAVLSTDAAACGNSAKNTACPATAAVYVPAIVAADFSTTIDNKYLTYVVGTVAQFVQSGGEVVEQDVTSQTKMIMGVKCMVVHDLLKSPSGDLLED